MLESLDTWPLNIALLGKGNTVSAEAMWEQLRGGAAGFKLHEDWVVGGSLRDALFGASPGTGTSPRTPCPDRVVELFPGAVYENRFGTVAVRRDGELFEITTFRTEHDYADHRRPHRVEFGDDLEPTSPAATSPSTRWPGAVPRPTTRRATPPDLVDPFGGLDDLGRRRLRAVGDPADRFREDALRMVRAVRLAATHDLTVEARTLEAIARQRRLVAHLSGERVGAELERLLEAPTPSIGLRLAVDTGLLAAIAPELAAQRGIPQNKTPGEDLWDHTLRTVDAAPAARPGRPPRGAAARHRQADHARRRPLPPPRRGGRRLAATLLRRLRFPRGRRPRTWRTSSRTTCSP